MARRAVTDHQYINAVTFDEVDGGVQIGMATASGLHKITIPASHTDWLRERLEASCARPT